MWSLLLEARVSLWSTDKTGPLHDGRLTSLSRCSSSRGSCTHLFTLSKPCSPLRIKGNKVFLRVNRVMSASAPRIKHGNVVSETKEIHVSMLVAACWFSKYTDEAFRWMNRATYCCVTWIPAIWFGTISVRRYTVLANIHYWLCFGQTFCQFWPAVMEPKMNGSEATCSCCIVSQWRQLLSVVP